MRRILAIALCALMLSGCIAEWKSNQTGPRWHDGPGIQPMANSGMYGGTPPLENSGPVSSPPAPPPPPQH